MKRENPHLSTALLLGLFGNVLLCSQTAYWTRIGLLLLPASCLVLSGVAAAFAVAWRQGGDNRLLRRGWRHCACRPVGGMCTSSAPKPTASIRA